MSWAPARVVTPFCQRGTTVGSGRSAQCRAYRGICGSGIVEAVGLQVSEFKPGDHVIACLSVFCGHCDYCLTGKTHLCQTRPVRAKTDPPKLSWKGQPVNQFANLSAYAEKMLVHENALVKIDDAAPNQPPVANADTERVVVGTCRYGQQRSIRRKGPVEVERIR